MKYPSITLEFLRKIKQSKYGKYIFILVTLIIVSTIISGMPDKKEASFVPESVCSQFNKNLGLPDWYMTEGNLLSCEKNKCATIAADVDTRNLPIIGQAVSFLTGLAQGGLGTYPGVHCTSFAKVGEKIIAKTSSDAARVCESNVVIQDKSLGFSQNVYECKYVAPEDQCKSSEKGIANLATSIGIGGDSCKSNYFIVLYGGGALLLFLLLAVI